MRNLLKDKRGVFGLNAVQSFFAIILGVALLAYVIVIIMGTLSGNTILTQPSGSVTAENLVPDDAGTDLSVSTLDGCIATVTLVTGINDTGSTKTLNTGNYSVTQCTITNLTDDFSTEYNVSYSYVYNSIYQTNQNTILTSTGTGITGFFSSVSPIYAILAVLVIILVLTVLVRVVQNPSRGESSPQL